MACLLAFGVANATGLGGIVVSSNLGQPLQAEIELVSVDKADRSSISAKLATIDAFKIAGIEYPYAIPRLKFDIVGRESSQPRIRITSDLPVNEPFVTLLVEVAWSSGKLLREYTFLLDPVGYTVPGQSAAIVNPVAPVVAPATQMTAPAAVAPPTPVADGGSDTSAPVVEESEAAPATEAKVPSQASPEKAELPPADSVTVRQDVASEALPPRVEVQSAPIAVVRGDTLSGIALKTKPFDVSLERMLLALYRANTSAFVGNNMNLLQAGKVLRLPDAAEIEAIGQKEAVREYRAQVADWNVYRQQLAAARAQSGGQASQQTASGKVTASVAESVPAAKEPAKEILKLSKGQAPGDQATGGKSSKEEDAIAREKSLRDAEEHIALLEKNVKDLQRLADLKKQQAEAAAPSAPAATSTGGAPTVVKPTPKPAVPAPAPVPEPAAPSFLDELLGDPLLLGGAAAALLLILGGGFWLSRRRSIRPAKVALAEEASGHTGRIAAPVIPSPETGDFTQQATGTDGAEEKTSEEVDPIAEADLFLSFGRYAQAEEVLKDALSTNPGNLPVILKLLAIYANRKDANTFLTYARQLKESGDESAWAQAAAMGRELEPNNPLYGGEGEAPSEQAPAAEPAVDFDLGFGGANAPQTDMMKTMVMDSPTAKKSDVESPNLIDFMLEETPTQESTVILSAEDTLAVQVQPMDFDVTGTRPPVAAGAPQPTTDEVDDLVFDVTSTHPGIKADTGATATDLPKDTDDLIFDVTATHPGIAAMEQADKPAADESLAFTLDIPEDFKQGAEPEKPQALDIGLGDISLNLDGLSATASEGVADTKDERWQEVATKLDLAKAYQEMGDAAGAREILDEVMRDGDDSQRASAQAMLDQL